MGGTTIMLAAMSLDLGGAETHVVSLAKELQRQGCRVLVTSSGGRLVEQLTDAGIVHHAVPLHSRAPWNLLRAVRRMRALAARERVDLVHAHARIPAWVATWACHRRGIPLVTTYHGVYDARLPWRWFSTWGDWVIAVSGDVKEHLVKRFGVDGGRIRVVPNGIDVDLFRPDVSWRSLQDQFGAVGAPRIVHIGRQTGPNAAVALALCDALPQVLDRFPAATLWIVGEGDGLPEIEQKAGAMNRWAGRRVALVTGGRTDTPAIFSLADVVVGVARVALEAMACSRPVVVAGEGGYQGILTEQQMESLRVANFTARGSLQHIQPDLLARDLLVLLEDEALRVKLGEAGRRLVLEHLSIERMAAEVLEVYQQVLKREDAR